MKRYFSFFFLLFFLTLALLLTACGKEAVSEVSPAPTPKAYDSTTYMVHNEETDMDIYCVETRPTALAEGEKAPVIVYVHGGGGAATNFQNIYRVLAEDKVAGFSFECCGGNSTNAKSDGSELYASHYTHRISDLEAIVQHVKTLDYVDTERIYLWGESYGGIVISLYAAHHPEIAGLILVSTGLQEGMMGQPQDGGRSGYMAQYDFDDAFDAIKAYPGPVICFNGQEDETGAHDAGLRQIEIYNERDSGTAEFVSLENSGHSYAAFSQAAKEITLARLRQFIGVI